jgi:2-oxoglutarate ferredoxin oxidoreductase subunit gamma
MEETRQIRVSGFAGQGIILAGAVLGHAAVRDGKWVAGSSSYGAAARGGSCRSDVVISDKPILFPHVIEPDILIAMSQEAYDRYTRNIDRENGMVFYDQFTVSVKDIPGVKQVGVSSTELAAKELNNAQAANMVILSVMAAMTEIVSQNAMISAVNENVPARFRDVNMQAVKLGFAQARTEQKHLGDTGQWQAKSGALRPVVDNDLCVVCNLCPSMCPELCISINSQKSGIEIDYDFCKDCGICVWVCPKKAIKMA